MNSTSAANAEHDERMATEIIRSLSALQQSIHAAIEAGLKVNATIETMHKVGEHFPEPLVEIDVERVIRLT